jgi:hypothetical protein
MKDENIREENERKHDYLTFIVIMIILFILGYFTNKFVFGGYSIWSMLLKITDNIKSLIN